MSNFGAVSPTSSYKSAWHSSLLRWVPLCRIRPCHHHCFVSNISVLLLLLGSLCLSSRQAEKPTEIFQALQSRPAWADPHYLAGTRNCSGLWVHLTAGSVYSYFWGKKKILWITYFTDTAVKPTRHFHLMYCHAEIITKPKLRFSQGKAFLPCLHSYLKKLIKSEGKKHSSPANK